MANSNTLVHVWRDDLFAFVFCGDANEPSSLWEQRDSVDSDLSDWLKTQDKQPPLDEELSITWPMFAGRARTVTRMLVKKLEADGYTILNPRPRDTYSGGRKPKKPVYTPFGWFPGVRSAARANGVSAALVSFNCSDSSKPDWTFDAP